MDGEYIATFHFLHLTAEEGCVWAVVREGAFPLCLSLPKRAFPPILAAQSPGSKPHVQILIPCSPGYIISILTVPGLYYTSGVTVPFLGFSFSHFLSRFTFSLW